MSDDEKDTANPNVEIIKQELPEVVVPEELFENLIESRSDPVQVSEKVKQVTKGSRKYLIAQIKELCEKQGLNSVDLKLSRQKKADLQKILADTLSKGVEQVMQSEIDEIGITAEVIEKTEGDKKTQFVVAALTRLNLAAMKGVEILSQRLELGYEIKGWAESFESGSMRDELQNCLHEIYTDNPWLEDYLSCWTRYGMLMISSALMSLRKQALREEAREIYRY